MDEKETISVFFTNVQLSRENIIGKTFTYKFHAIRKDLKATEKFIWCPLNLQTVFQKVELYHKMRKMRRQWKQIET